MRALLAFRDQNAESWAVWREWMIDRESNVPNMQAYWTQILATPDGFNGSNVGAFVPVNGSVTIEAEDYTAAAPGTGTAAACTWQTNSTITGAVGVCMQALPNTGLFLTNSTAGPRLDYRIDFRAAGTYNVYLRLPYTNISDDAVSVGLDGTLVSSNIPNTTGSFRWRTTNGNSNPCVLNITAPGVHTLNIWMCDDGCVFDRIYITTATTLPFLVGDPGPAESSKRPAGTEHTLTVVNGTGDGTFGTDSLVPIIANAPKQGYVFDRWTGPGAAFVVSATTASTYFAMAPQDTQVTASYKIDPAADLDSDGIADAWEMANFHSTGIASATTDSDGDGASDLAEFLAGTDPNDPASKFEIAAVVRTGADQVTLTWPGVSGKTYTISAKSDLQEATWLPLAIGVPGRAPYCSFDLPLSQASRFFRVQQE
jgi:uncharacterized repeat protein (TIGR02543 family)